MVQATGMTEKLDSVEFALAPFDPVLTVIYRKLCQDLFLD